MRDLQCPGKFGPCRIIPGMEIGLFAVTTRLLKRTGDLLIYDVQATADADTTATITLPTDGPWEGGNVITAGSTSLKAWAQAILQAPAALSLWAITTQNNTTVVATKATTGSSGSGSPQLQIFVERIK